MDPNHIIIEYLILPIHKEKLEKAKEKLKTLSNEQLAKLIAEKSMESSKIHESYDSQYYNITNDEKNLVLKEKMINELGRMAFSKRQSLEFKFLDKILNL